jgi:prepilin signal peptidase PulO-like enzyme (type II secretory pathway)
VTSKVFKPYPFLYPIIELVLGCGYLSLYLTTVWNIVKIAIMLLNALSVAKAISQKRQINCACLGTVI